MPTSTFTYNLDGAMTAAVGEPFSSIRRHNYTRLPIEIIGTGGGISLRYDSYGRRLHKIGKQTIFYRSGAHHPAADRTKELEKGDEIHHTLVELVDGTEIVYLFTPAGQTILRRKDGYARVARDHLRSVRAEISLTENISAHYSAFGKAIITGGELRRAFAGYEPDAETGLYNANRRLYAPALRLFVSVDPRLQNASPYPYCNNDPFNNIDPTGEISAAAVNGIIAGLLLVIGVIVCVLTSGVAAGPVTAVLTANDSVETITDGLAVATTQGVVQGAAGSEAEAVEGAVESSSPLKDFFAAHMPFKASEYAKFGAGFGFASAVASNGTGLATQASNGEHISAWQAVRSMLIAPVIAGISGGIGGGISGIGLSRAEGLLASSNMLLLGSVAADAIDSAANTALDGQITKRSGWESIGIQMAVAVGEALVMAPFFSRVKSVPKGTIIEIRISTYSEREGEEKLFGRETVSLPIRPLTQWERLKGVFRPDFGRMNLNYRENGVPVARVLKFYAPSMEYLEQFLPPPGQY